LGDMPFLQNLYLSKTYILDTRVLLSKMISGSVPYKGSSHTYTTPILTLKTQTTIYILWILLAWTNQTSTSIDSHCNSTTLYSYIQVWVFHLTKLSRTSLQGGVWLQKEKNDHVVVVHLNH
jgi:hypothetical protein